MVRWVVQAILVAQQRPEDRTELQQSVPVIVGAGQTAHLQAEDEADVIQSDLRHEPLEAEASLGSGPAAALVLVDDENAISGPTEIHGPLSQGILALCGLGVLTDLMRSRLSNVHDREAVEMPGLDLRGPWQRDGLCDRKYRCR